MSERLPRRVLRKAIGDYDIGIVPRACEPGDRVVARLGDFPRLNGWKFTLDLPATNTVQRSGESLLFKGKIVNPEGPTTVVRIIRESDEQELGRLETKCDDATYTRHGRSPRPETFTFTGLLDLTLPGRYRIEAGWGTGNRTPLFRLSLRDPSAEATRLLFMHIAKTGGSSVNRYLAKTLGPDRCAFHLESDARWHDPMRRRELDNKTAISGHINHRAFVQQVDMAEYVALTVLRNPLNHVVSHLAYIRHLAARSQRLRLARHSPIIQAFAAKLAATDFTDHGAMQVLIAGLTAKERVLVENCQTRYLSAVPAGRPVDKLALDAALDALHEFNIVGFTEKIDVLIDRLASRMGWPPPRTIPRENYNLERYGIDPADPEMRAVLQPLIHFDEALYRYARKVFADGNDKPLRRRQKKKARAARVAASLNRA